MLVKASVKKKKYVYMYVSFQSFMTGNLYHHIHNLALLAVPFAKRPNLVSMYIFKYCGYIK